MFFYLLHLLNESQPNLFRGRIFWFPSLLSSGFCYDLDLLSQGQALRVFLSLKCILPLFCQKYVLDLDETYPKASKTDGI